MPASKLIDKVKTYPVSVRNRVNLARKTVDHLLPQLNNIQLDSYKAFLQKDVEPHLRENDGLQALFTSVFPFYSNDRKVRLEFESYEIGESKYTPEEAMEKDRSYAAPVKATIRLILEESSQIKEQEIYVADIPLMSDEGTFIVNGAVRVVVSQVHRSPGVVFDYNDRAGMFHSRLIPEKGSWLEFEIVKEVLYVRIDRKSRILASTFLRAIGIEKDDEICRLFYKTETVSFADKTEYARFEGRVTVTAVPHPTVENELLCRTGQRLDLEVLEALVASGVTSLELITAASLEDNEVILNTIEREKIFSQDEACVVLYTAIRGAEPSTAEVAKSEIIRRWRCCSCAEHAEEKAKPVYIDQYEKPTNCPVCGADGESIIQEDRSIFFNDSLYSLGKVGRYKINKRFNYAVAGKETVLSPDDIVQTIAYLLKVRIGENPCDDIDHLGNRRVRSVGEQLANHLKICFSRMERLAKERMTIQDHDTLTPQNLISIKPITAGIKEFFGTAQLSQFMDQTNPISSITHKRRLNALGPGGLTRERAGFEVRDIHYTHYGRMCPIETPEGPNIGLIVSLASFARINEYGFIETPYYRIVDGKLTDQVDYLSAIEEDRYVLTPFNSKLAKDNSFTETMIPARSKGSYPMVFPKDANYMDVAPSQIFSVSSSLIPFLEHDDANRALMGSNMMRQAVPLLFPEAPFVGTGIEEQAAAHSGFVKIARDAGKVESVDCNKIVINVPGKKEKDVYHLYKSQRTNQDTFFNQRPLVSEGEEVKKGQTLTNGPAIENGELALGKNVLTAFMTWEGYNYEDAILMSQRLLKDDVYTSIHIEEFEVEARETKLGCESLTRDIPNISEEDYKDLDDDGIIRIGTTVKPGSILVGKVTPKGHTEITPEYKLLHSIFGEKARDVKDSSLRVPHGNGGTVIGVRRYTRDNRDDLKPGVIDRVKIYLAKKRKLREGDKFAGRHGNKGVVARVMPIEDMPYLEDGTPVDIVLNPLGVPSRMNLGQIFELTLGLVAKKMEMKFSNPVFNGIKWEEIQELLRENNLPDTGKLKLMDGRTGEAFKNPVTVGWMYYLKLSHLADDKIHARSTGPYSLVTQQPLGGKAQFGGQRVGEMEVWAIEAYGAANILQEFLTVKSDAMEGRTRVYEAIIKGEYVASPGVPESFNVLVQELRGLGLKLDIFDINNNHISITPNKKDRDKRQRLI